MVVVGSGDGARSSELLDRWYEAAVGCRRPKVRVSFAEVQWYSGTVVQENGNSTTASARGCEETAGACRILPSNSFPTTTTILQPPSCTPDNECTGQSLQNTPA